MLPRACPPRTFQSQTKDLLHLTSLHKKDSEQIGFSEQSCSYEIWEITNYGWCVFAYLKWCKSNWRFSRPESWMPGPLWGVQASCVVSLMGDKDAAPRCIPEWWRMLACLPSAVTVSMCMHPMMACWLVPNLEVFFASPSSVQAATGTRSTRACLKLAQKDANRWLSRPQSQMPGPLWSYSQTGHQQPKQHFSGPCKPIETSRAARFLHSRLFIFWLSLPGSGACECSGSCRRSDWSMRVSRAKENYEDKVLLDYVHLSCSCTFQYLADV